MRAAGASLYFSRAIGKFGRRPGTVAVRHEKFRLAVVAAVLAVCSATPVTAAGINSDSAHTQIAAQQEAAKTSENVIAFSNRSRGSLEFYKQAWGLITAGRIVEARRALRQARTRVPKDFLWLIDDALAWVSFYTKDYKGARAAFKKILAEHPNAYMSRKGLGFLDIEQGKFDSGVNHLRASFRQNPYQLLASYTIPANKLVKAKRFANAKQILELAEWVFPKSADVAFLLAKAYNGLGDLEAAAEMAVKAATDAPAYLHPYFESLKIDPKLVMEAYNAMGWGLLNSGDSESALKRFKQYFDHGGDSPNAYRGRGFTLFDLERYQEAAKDLEVAAEQEPGGLPPITAAIPVPGAEEPWTITYNATSTLGWTHLRVGKPKEAEKAFRKALEVYPDWFNAIAGLGFSLLAQGDKNGAAEKFRKALELSKGYPIALQGLKDAGYSP